MKITIDCGTDIDPHNELIVRTGDEGCTELVMTQDYLILGEKEIHELIKALKAFL